MSRLTERLRRGRAVSQPTAGDEPSDRHLHLSRELRQGSLKRGEQPVTDLLYERLGQDLATEVERLASQARELDQWPLGPADPALRRVLVLHFGAWLGVPGVAEKTGLPTVQPPENVHAMARGPLAAAGGTYDADLVVGALASAGIDMDAVRDGLDFGCSSGRVVRVLAAAYPDIRWWGCDANGQAIDWARENLAGISFFPNGPTPPLPLEDGALDLAFAISVWSHFEPQLGCRWFDEMHRLIRPGGHLVMTTHGFTSLAHEAAAQLRPSSELFEIAVALYRRGWWYRCEFGEGGDWGVVDPGWGTTFLSPEWILAELCPGWRVLEFAAGRNQGNQDVYVLERA